MMNPSLEVALDAARASGELLRANFGKPLDVAAFEAHDIKLDLDVRSQALITSMVLARFPDHAIYGEEGIAGNQSSEWQWIIDPIDGTVNYFYSIPHFSISIALRHRGEIVMGVIYDPMRDEMWQIESGGTPTLNGAPIAVSRRARLQDAILSVGFAKSNVSIRSGLPLLAHYAQQVRKCRMMGSATLDMAYVACGRLDGYLENSISLWDIAAGKLLVEAAGGRVTLTPRADNPHKYSIIASSGLLELSLE